MNLTLQEERIKIENPDANLWRAVIDQAIEDLSQPKLRQAAVDWFASTAHEPGSFRWACDHLDLNPSAVLAALNKAKELEKHSPHLEERFSCAWPQSSGRWVADDEGDAVCLVIAMGS